MNIRSLITLTAVAFSIVTASELAGNKLEHKALSEITLDIANDGKMDRAVHVSGV